MNDTASTKSTSYDKLREAIRELSAKMETQTSNLRDQIQSAEVRLTLLEKNEERRQRFEEDIARKIDALPEKISGAAKIAAEEVSKKQALICTVRMNEQQREKERESAKEAREAEKAKRETPGTWEWTRGRWDTLIWALVQAIALYLIGQAVLEKLNP